MPRTLKKIFSIVEKTGDRVIVFDSVSNQAYVVMDLHNYESLINGPTRKAPVKTGEDELAEEIKVWHKAHEGLVDQSLRPKESAEKIKVEPSLAEPNSISEPEIVVKLNKDQQVEAEKSGNKYYFEDLEQRED